LFILDRFTTRFDDDDFLASSASLDHIGASFFFEACLRSLIICKTTWLTNRLMPSVTQI